MSDALRIWAFDAYAARATSTATIAAGVTIVACRPRAMLNLRGDPADTARARAAVAQFDVTLPVEPNTAASVGATRMLWLGPDEWLLVSDDTSLEVLAGIAGGTVTDVSHGRAALRVSGPQVRAALSKGCALDLHPREFPLNRCAQTAIAKIVVLIDHIQPDMFDLYCSRSYAGSFWHWLTDAAAEYGCRIEGRPAA